MFDKGVADESENWREKRVENEEVEEKDTQDRQPRKSAIKPMTLDDDFSDDETPRVPYKKLVNDAIKNSRPKLTESKQDPIPVPREKAYRLIAPVQRPNIVEETSQKIIDSKIEMTVGDVWALSDRLAREIRKSITKTRRPIKPILTGGVFAQQGAFPFMEEDEGIFLEENALCINSLPPVDAFYVATDEDFGIQKGALVVPDPYLQYLATLKEGEAPKQVYTAMESAALRAVFPLIAGRQRVESVLDSGSQIVSMALSIAEELSIPWDPDVQIYMQSANGQLKKSAGLARNVAYIFGDLTLYLQVHIIDQPAYHVLLGRPFEILTESTIQNRRDGSQTLTIRDPNSERRQTIPTVPRGVYSAITQPKKRATVEEVPDEGEKSRKTVNKENQSEAKGDKGFR